MAAFVEWVTGEILQEVPHRQLVWTIPKVLRPTFRRDRRLLGELSRAAWRSLCQYFGHALCSDSVPAAIFAIQTYGDQLNWHPHLHSLLAVLAHCFATKLPLHKPFDCSQGKPPRFAVAF